jgi:hypothetical protein
VLIALVAVVALQRGAASVPVAVAAAPEAAAQPVAAAAVAEPAAAPEPAAQPEEPAAEPEKAVESPVQLASTAQPGSSSKAKSRSNKSNDDAEPSARNSKRKKGGDAEEASAKPAASAAKEKSSDSLSVDDILAKKPEPTKKGSPNIDDLLEGAVSAKKAAPKEESAGAGGLPETPSREQMKSAYGSASAKASKCKGPGTASAMVTISGKSGRATSVNVAGVEGPAKACVEKAVRSTSFPKFQKDSMEVKFPFKLPG